MIAKTLYDKHLRALSILSNALAHWDDKDITPIAKTLYDNHLRALSILSLAQAHLDDNQITLIT
jgi:hypothetical protein